MSPLSMLFCGSSTPIGCRTFGSSFRMGPQVSPGMRAVVCSCRICRRSRLCWPVSHKYQVKRLQLWCEAKLSEQIDTPQVCGILCQAHLFQAKQLEQACLRFIKDHADQVFTLPAYLELIKKWPQVALKISLFSAGVHEEEQWEGG